MSTPPKRESIKKYVARIKKYQARIRPLAARVGELRTAAKLKLVLVEWDDAASDTDDWVPCGVAAMGTLSPIVSVGFMVTSNRKVIILAQSFGSEADKVADRITIPRHSVRRIRRLK